MTRRRWIAYRGASKEPKHVADLGQTLESFKSLLYARGLATYKELTYANNKLRFERVKIKILE